MAHIHLIHNADDIDAAERVADVLYFLDYDVNLLSRESPDPESVSEDPNEDVVLVLWTASAQKDRWLTAQCRDIANPDQLITIVPKSARAAALPLMLHRGSIVRLEYQATRMRFSTLQTLLSEVGRRSGRNGLVSGVAALLRPEEEERVQALAQWVAANPDDRLAPTVESVLEARSSGDIHNALVEITNGVVASKGSAKNVAAGVLSGFKMPSKFPPVLFYAAIGIIAGGAFLATLLPIINRPSETVEIEKIDLPVQSALAERSDPLAPEREGARSESPVVEDEGEVLLADAEEELEAVGDVEAEYVIDPLPGGSLMSDVEEPSLGVPDPDEMVIEAVIPPVTDQPAAVPEQTDPEPDQTQEATEEIVEDAVSVSQEEPASETDDESDETQQAELLLPYIAGTQQPGDAFTDRLADETGAPIMVVLPQGTFTMGSPLSERGRDVSEGPQRTVNIGRPFAVSKYEITVAEFEKFMTATDYEMSGSCQIYSDDAWTEKDIVTFQDTGYGQSQDHPATCIDWNAATAYTQWLSQETGATYRLLSEAEWEYAARAGSEQAFPFGDNANEGCGFMNGADEDAPAGVSSGLALKCTDGAAYTSRVGTYTPNRFGLYDMHGNVWEWTRDTWHSSYDGAPRSGTAWDYGQSSDRVIRGGSWFTYDFWLRSASRKGFAPSDRRYDLGFRIARDL